MKKAIMTAATLAVACAGATAALAGDDWESKLEEKFRKIDTNGDGEITEAEYLAYKAESARKDFAEMSGGDDRLTLAEAKDAHKANYAEKKEKKAKKKRDGAGS